MRRVAKAIKSKTRQELTELTPQLLELEYMGMSFKIKDKSELERLKQAIIVDKNPTVVTKTGRVLVLIIT